MKPNPHPIQASVRKKFIDSFDRENTDLDLGTTEDGSRWDNLRGLFKVFFNRAVSETPPDQYPMATVNMPHQDVEISLKDIDSGVGAALWVTDSGNWWGVGLQQEEVPCNCSQGTQCDRWNAQNCSVWNSSNCISWFCSRWSGSTNTGVCTSWSRGNCSSWNRICTTWNRNCVRWGVFGNCLQFGNVTSCATWNSSCANFNAICNATRWNANTCQQNSCGSANASNCRSWNSQTCNRWFEFTFDCQTCYPQYIRVFRSINATVSTVFSAVITKTFQTISSTFGSLSLFVQSDLSAPSAKSMKVFTSEDSLSAKVFSDTNLANEIIVDETIVYEPTGAQIVPTYGIIVNPSSYNQNNYIGEIDITKF